MRRGATTGIRLGALLTTAMALSTVMQFAIGALGPALTADIGVSPTQLGGLSAAYYLAAALLSRPLGRRIDAISARSALIGIFGGTALAMTATAAAGSYPLLLLAVLPAGAAAAAGNPATNRIIANLPGRHGTLVAVKQSGVQIGALSAGALLPALALAISWRGALLCVAAACIAALAMTPWTPPVRAAGRDGTARRPPMPPGVARIAAYALFMGAGMSAVTTYLPLYGAERLALSHAAAGSLVAVVGAGGVLSRLWWTRLHERRTAPGDGSLTILVGLATAAAVATGAVVAADAGGTWLLWLGAALLGLSAAAWNGLAMLAVLDRTPAASAAEISGTVLTAFYLGLCVSAPAFGAIVEATGGYTAGWCLTALSFGLAALAAGRRGAGRG